MTPIPETEDPSQRLQSYYQQKESNWTGSSIQRHNRKKREKRKTAFWTRDIYRLRQVYYIPRKDQ